MTSIIRDMEELYMHPQGDGMAFSRDDDPKTVPVYLRVEIDAASRRNWTISDVWMLEEESAFNDSGVWRKDEVATKLEGDFKFYAINFIRSQHEDFLQDRVDLEVIPEPAEAYDAPMVM